MTRARTAARKRWESIEGPRERFSVALAAQITPVGPCSAGPANAREPGLRHVGRRSRTPQTRRARPRELRAARQSGPLAPPLPSAVRQRSARRSTLQSAWRAADSIHEVRHGICRRVPQQRSTSPFGQIVMKALPTRPPDDLDSQLEESLIELEDAIESARDTLERIPSPRRTGLPSALDFRDAAKDAQWKGLLARCRSKSP